jgi:uncharacterized delta-60 repeat protein
MKIPSTAIRSDGLRVSSVLFILPFFLLLIGCGNGKGVFVRGTLAVGTPALTTSTGDGDAPPPNGHYGHVFLPNQTGGNQNVSFTIGLNQVVLLSSTDPSLSYNVFTNAVTSPNSITLLYPVNGNFLFASNPAQPVAGIYDTVQFQVTSYGLTVPSANGAKNQITLAASSYALNGTQQVCQNDILLNLLNIDLVFGQPLTQTSCGSTVQIYQLLTPPGQFSSEFPVSPTGDPYVFTVLLSSPINITSSAQTTTIELQFGIDNIFYFDDTDNNGFFDPNGTCPRSCDGRLQSAGFTGTTGNGTNQEAWFWLGFPTVTAAVSQSGAGATTTTTPGSTTTTLPGSTTTTTISTTTTTVPLDTSFGTGGIVTTPIGTIDDEANSLAIDSNGKLVAAGFSNSGAQKVFALARYNTDGSLDTTFNATGIVTTPIGTIDDEANSLAIQSDGKLVAAGFSNNSGHFVFALVRYNTDGSLDTTFNTTGIVTTSIGTIDDEIDSLAIQSDGKLVVAGYSFTGSQDVFALARYNTNGSLDTTFNTTGIVTTTVGHDDFANALAIDSNGKLVAAGLSNNGAHPVFALVRYNTNGTLDTTFNTTGIVTTTIGTVDDEANSLAIDSNGKLVAAGYSDTGTQKKFALVRYNTDGSLDTTFNTTGIVTTAIGTVDDEANSLAIDSNGKLVAAGFSFNDTQSQNEFALARYNTNGTLDTTFHTTGIVTTAIDIFDDEANSLAIQSDGKLVAAGFFINSTNAADEFALVRYLP